MPTSRSSRAGQASTASPLPAPLSPGLGRALPAPVFHFPASLLCCHPGCGRRVLFQPGDSAQPLLARSLFYCWQAQPDLDCPSKQDPDIAAAAAAVAASASAHGAAPWAAANAWDLPSNGFSPSSSLDKRHRLGAPASPSLVGTARSLHAAHPASAASAAASAAAAAAGSASTTSKRSAASKGSTKSKRPPPASKSRRRNGDDGDDDGDEEDEDEDEEEGDDDEEEDEADGKSQASDIMASLLSVGDVVLVQFGRGGQTSYPGRILEISKDGRKARVRYDGLSSAWDEWRPLKTLNSVEYGGPRRRTRASGASSSK